MDVLEELRSAATQPAIVVDLSTIGIEAATTAASLMKDHGVNYLDCPVSGGTAAAKAGTISVMCAGSEPAFDQCAPLFEIIAGNTIYLGEKAGLGQAMKLANNYKKTKQWSLFSKYKVSK